MFAEYVRTHFPAAKVCMVMLLCSAAFGGYPGTAAFAEDVAAGPESSAQPAKPQPGATGDDALSEIVVTATRREQNLQDIPFNISAVSGDNLAKAGVTSLNSLAQAVPGLQNVDTGPDTRGGNNEFTMRGLRTDAAGSGGGVAIGHQLTVSTVSTYLGETPIFYPLAVKDLDRVEVLKGPQGTLYGSGSEAGTIRLIPKRPEFDAFSGTMNVEGGISQDSGKPNSALDGVLNIPLASNVAFRVGAGYERLGGFIDAVDLVERQQPGNQLSPAVSRVPSDPLSGYVTGPTQHDVNTSEQWYVRGALRWQASDKIDTELSFTHQHIHVDDAQISNPEYAGGTYNFGVGGPLGDIPAVVNDPNATNTYRAGGKYLSTADALSPSSNELNLGGLVVTADLGFATLTSSTSAYRVRANEDSTYTAATEFVDGSNKLYGFSVYYGGFPRYLYYINYVSQDEAFTQELRLVSNGNGPFSYVLGGYYQDQDFSFEGTTYAPGIDAFLARNPNHDITYFQPNDGNGYHFEDNALFGELTYKITPRWQVTGGMRQFWQEFRNRGYAVQGDLVAADVNNQDKVHDHIFKANTSYDVSDDLKVYATYSEGFRRGGANVLASAGPYASLPIYQSFAPDKAKNYEIGLKGSLFDRRLRFSADIFLIDLQNFQFNAVTPSGNPAVFNGTAARSKGFEGDADFRVTRDFTLRAAYSYTQAKVRKGFTIQDYALLGNLDPAHPNIITAVSIPGDARLPSVPDNTVNVGADYVVHLGADVAIILHADGAYRSSSPATIDPTSIYYWTIPSSFTANTRVTYDTGQAWSADVFVNNLTNETAFTGGVGPQTVTSPFSGRYVARPRTFGAGLHYRF